jgi:hypothetical protein
MTKLADNKKNLINASVLRDVVFSIWERITYTTDTPPIKTLSYNDAIDGIKNLTIIDGIYRIVDRPNTGNIPLYIPILNYKPCSDGYIKRQKSSRAQITLSGNLGSSGEVNIKINGNPILVDLKFGPTETDEQIGDNIISELVDSNYKATRSGTTIQFESMPNYGFESNGYTFGVIGDIKLSSCSNKMEGGTYINRSIREYSLFEDNNEIKEENKNGVFINSRITDSMDSDYF